MICVNELNELKCRKKAILLPLLVMLAPYAPHITEELWQLAGQAGSVLDASYPEFREEYVRESAKAYPVAINGKTRTEITIGLEASQAEVEEIILANELVQKWLEGKAPKKIVYVKNRMINVVI
jgi:leucyl-tRNA synthetase